MFNFHKDHKSLANTALFVFVGLSIFIAVVPAFQMQETKPLTSMEPLTEQQHRGFNIYIAENCVSCHTQQVRNIEMDNAWGERPSIPSDYYFSKKRMDVWRQSPSILGSERTGPDLTNVGKRQSGEEWHLLHLYNPRTVVKESIMPGYPWLFEEKNEQDIAPDDRVIPVPASFLRHPSKKIVATQQALDLVAYLQSLEQPALQGDGTAEFIASIKKKKATVSESEETGNLPDGTALYASTCAACHQADGEGLPGAFPPLAGSAIVNDENPETLIRIILEGYDARPEYGVMAPFADMLSDEEIAAIATHERGNWGNNAPAVSPQKVKEIRKLIQNLKE